LEEKVQNHRVYKINFEEIKKILKTKKQKQKLDRSKMSLKPQLKVRWQFQKKPSEEIISN
jgi:hypothetical protein